MTLQLDMPARLEKELQTVILTTLRQAIQDLQQQHQNKEWMSLKEGAAYAGVSYNTLMKYREMGLRVCEIEGVKRISKSEIDTFFSEHSF
ncbi:helix-turn-helix domain-containing protein [Lysinibacillus sp. FSL K6-0057]|uniref:helix-turn-helix domain-containing protein n=1 Tax=Lysinibacillus sp. FSL K6-0057 TaxID=2921411 RepID=UPI00315A16BD